MRKAKQISLTVQSGCSLQECKGNEQILGVSCLSLRNKNGDVREVVQSDQIAVVCSCCNKQKILGKSTAALLRLEFDSGDEVLCDKCMDILTEVGVFGHRVLVESSGWSLSSQVARVSSVYEFMECGRCTVKRNSHIHIKYYDVTRARRIGRFRPVRYIKLCSVCVSEILNWMRDSEDVRCANKFVFKKESSQFVFAAGVRI